VELAFATAAVFAAAKAPANVILIEAGEGILPGYSPRFVARAGQALAARGVAVRTGTPVERVKEGAVVLLNGERLAADEVVWVTGAVALPFLPASGLPVDRRGFLLVDRALRSVADPRVFAAGDCATLADRRELAKAGVYAVREAPILWRSLAAALGGGEPPRYEPQSSFLALLNTGDGRALLRWRRLVAHGRWAWWLKDWIDRGFMRRYQRLTP
jgi:NADH dehydrogenase FAD-containing subunit